MSQKLLRFLIVDDDPDELGLFMEAAARVDARINCSTALDGEDALKQLLAPGAILPDVIFLDLNMPRINGRQCLEEIRKRDDLAGVPVIIYSTTSFHRDREELQSLGAARFITKPSSFEGLCNIIAEVSGLEE